MLQPHTRFYITPTLTQKLFGNMKRASKGYTGVDIPLFPTMLVQGPILQGEGSAVLVEQETEVPQPSYPSQTHDADEAASTKVDVRLGGAATIFSSLDAGQDSGNIDKTPSMPYDSPLPGGHTPGNLQESKKVYSTAFTKLIMKVKNLEKRVKSNKARRRAKFIVSDDEEDLEDSSKQGKRIADIDQDFDIYLPVSTVGASVTTAEPSAPSKTTIKTYTRTTRGVTIREPNTRQRLSPQQQIDPKNKGKGKMVESEKPSKKKDQVKADEELAKRLKEEMQVELKEEARIKRLA
ncbi:hypothetical protein Tco_0446780 [Tanacetum coccineum]